VIYKAQNIDGKSRHICLRYNTTRQLLSNEVISIDFVSSKDNQADPFTRSLSGECINCGSRGMRLKPKHTESA